MGERITRAEEKARTRQAILAAARELLTSRGADELTSRAIAEAAGVAVGTVFLHFPTTTRLFEALLDVHLEAALARGFATMKAKGLVPRLCHLARCLFESYDADQALSRLYLTRTLFPDDARQGDPRLDELMSWVGGEVARSVERGHIDSVEPALAGLLFFSLYFTLLVGGLRGALSREQQLSQLEAGLERVFPRRSKP